MRKNVILGIALLTTALFTTTGNAQTPDYFKQTSLEAGWGYNVPTSLLGGASGSDYSGVSSFYAGARYEIDALWGVRGTYAFNKFSNDDNQLNLKTGLTVHKLMAEATFNISRAIQQQGPQAFEVLTHAGLGLSFGASEQNSGSTDTMGSLQFGLMPTYHINDRLSVHLDATYVANFSQDYGFTGASAKLSGDGNTGGYFLANIGLAYRLKK